MRSGFRPLGDRLGSGGDTRSSRWPWRGSDWQCFIRQSWTTKTKCGMCVKDSVVHYHLTTGCARERARQKGASSLPPSSSFSFPLFLHFFFSLFSLGLSTPFSDFSKHLYNFLSLNRVYHSVHPYPSIDPHHLQIRYPYNAIEQVIQPLLTHTKTPERSAFIHYLGKRLACPKVRVCHSAIVPMKQNQANQATQDESSGDDLLLALQGPPQSSFYDTLLNQAFPNSDAAITFCRRLCAQFGFTVKQESSTHRNIYVYCSREGFPDSRRNPKSNPKRNRPSKRCDCRWRVVLNESKNTHEWRFRKSNNPDASLHNHELMRPEEIEQAWPKEVLDMICDLARQQLSTHDIRGRVQMRFPEITWNERRFYNRLSEERQKIRQRDTVLRAQELTVELNKVCMAASGCEELTRYAHAQARQLLKSVCDMAQIDIATLPQPIVLDPDEDEFKEWDHAETIETAPKGHTTVVVPRHTFHVRVHNQRTMNEMHVLRNRRRSRSSLTLEDDVSEQAGRKQARLFSHDEAAAQAQAHAQAQAAAAQMAVATQYNVCPAPKVEGGLVPSAASSRNSQQQFLFQQQQQQHHSMAMQTFNGVPHQHHHHHSTRPISYPQRPHHHAPPPPPPPPPPSQSVPPAPPAHPYHQPTPPGAEYSSSSPMPYPPLDASGSTAVASTTSTPSPASQSSAQHLMYPASTTTTTTTATSSNTTKLRSSSFSDMATSMPPNQLDSSARRRSFQPGLHPGMDPTISYAFHPSSGLIHEHHRDAPNGDFPLGQRMPQSMMVVSGERGPRQNQVPCYDGYGW